MALTDKEVLRAIVDLDPDNGPNKFFVEAAAATLGSGATIQLGAGWITITSADGKGGYLIPAPLKARRT